jgi:hypothetical protein
VQCKKKRKKKAKMAGDFSAGDFRREIFGGRFFGGRFFGGRFWTAYSVPPTFLISTTGLSPLDMPK